MAKTKKELQAICNFILSGIGDGLGALSVVMKLDNLGLESALYAEAPLVFRIVIDNCFLMALLEMTKLLEKGDSITIDYLLNCLLGSINLFPKDEREEIKHLIADDRKQLQEYELPITVKIKRYRDWIIAHADKRHINNPKEIEQLPLFPDDISLTELEDVYKIILDILNNYRRILGLEFQVFSEGPNERVHRQLGGIEYHIKNSLDRAGKRESNSWG